MKVTHLCDRERLNKVFENDQVTKSYPSMEQEHHIVDGLDIKSDGITVAFIRVFASRKDNSFNKVIHRGIKEAIKHFNDEGFDVIRGRGDHYKDDIPGMHVIVENMASSRNEPLTVFIRSGNMDKFPNFNRIHNALIHHMTLKGFKRL